MGDGWGLITTRDAFLRRGEGATSCRWQSPLRVLIHWLMDAGTVWQRRPPVVSGLEKHRVYMCRLFVYWHQGVCLYVRWRWAVFVPFILHFLPNCAGLLSVHKSMLRLALQSILVIFLLFRKRRQPYIRWKSQYILGWAIIQTLC